MMDCQRWPTLPRLALLLLCLPLLGAAAAPGTDVRLVLPGGLVGEGRYFAGRSDRPAVLVLHDFLDTHRNPASLAIAARLSQTGHAVLTPTLSLGVSWRQEELPCAAVHEHQFEEDLRELATWVEWLVARGRSRIVLIGLGFAGWQVLAYANQLDRVSSGVRAVVMVSPGFAGSQAAAEVATLEQAVAAGDTNLTRIPLLHCANYTATADSALSYARWDAQRATLSVGLASLPVRAVVGGEDPRFDADWLAELDRAGALVQLVPDTADFSEADYFRALQELLAASIVVEG